MIETGVDMKKAMGDLGEVEYKIRAFQRLLREKVDDAVKSTAEDFLDELKKQIKASGIKTRSGELLNSWKVVPKGLARYQVRSTADHAVFLELGTRPHTISGSGGGWLKFRPSAEKLPNYPERNFSEDANGNVTGDFLESGLIVSRLDPLADGGDLGSYVAKSVRHPGNKAYRFFDKTIASKSWKTSLNNKIQNAVKKAKAEAGLE